MKLYVVIRDEYESSTLLGVFTSKEKVLEYYLTTELWYRSADFEAHWNCNIKTRKKHKHNFESYLIDYWTTHIMEDSRGYEEIELDNIPQDNVDKESYRDVWRKRESELRGLKNKKGLR